MDDRYKVVKKEGELPRVVDTNGVYHSVKCIAVQADHICRALNAYEEKKTTPKHELWIDEFMKHCGYEEKEDLQGNAG